VYIYQAGLVTFGKIMMFLLCLQETTILEKLVSKALEFFAPAEKVPKKLAETETLSFIKKVEPGPPG